MNKKIVYISVLTGSLLLFSGCSNSSHKENPEHHSRTEKTSSKCSIESHRRSSSLAASVDSSTSSKASSKKINPHQIAIEEAQNNNRPLSWEPIQNAQDAEKLMKQKYGDQGWSTVHGSIGISSPIYFTEMNSQGQQYIVLATGEITQDKNKVTPVTAPWTLNMAVNFYKAMVRWNIETQNSKFPQGDWAEPTNGEHWQVFSNNGKTIKFGFDNSNDAFTLTNNGNGTSTFNNGSGIQMTIDNSNHNCIDSNYNQNN